MKAFSIRSTALSLLLAVACAGPGSVIEVNHAADQLRAGQLSYLNDLLKGLGSRDPEVKTACIRALAAAGEPAVKPLRETVEEQSERSGPALEALGLMGDGQQAAFIRRYTRTAGLEDSARLSLESLEKLLFDRAKQGDLEAMDGYLTAFPESQRSEQIVKARAARVASLAYEQALSKPSIAALDQVLATYPDAPESREARITLGRLLLQDGWTLRTQGQLEQARAQASRAAEVDPSRADDARQLIGGTWLDEGAQKRKDGQLQPAIAAYQQAATFPAFRLEAERAQGDMLLELAQKQLAAGKPLDAIGSLDQAQQADASRRPEVARQKGVLQAGFTQQLTGSDPAMVRAAVLGLSFLGDEGRPALESYFATQFARKDFAGLEQTVQALADARKLATPAQRPTVQRSIDLFSSLLRSALGQTQTEVTRLFSTQEFVQGWRPELDPTDPRQYPLVFRVEEVASRHFGLARVGLTMQVLLGDAVIDIAKGTLLPDTEVDNRLRQGRIGDDASLPVLTRVQLCARYAGLLAQLRRRISAHPDHFMAYAVGLTVLPAQPSDWLLVADGFERFEKDALVNAPVLLDPLRSSVHNGGAVLVQLEKDTRSLTLKVSDPVVTLSGTPEGQKAVADRALAILLNTSRIAFGLYPGLDRYTVMVGGLDVRAANVWPVTAGRFEPEARLMWSQKTVSRQDWKALRTLNGQYGATEQQALELQWYRWGGRK